MFTRIVVGAEGSSEGKDAVVLGAALAAATGAGLTLLQSYAPYPISTAGLDRRSQIDAAERQLSRDRDEFAPSAHIETVADPNRARALGLHAKSWHADLIVIGSTRSAPQGRSSISRTGRRLVHSATTALAVARRGIHHEGLTLSTIAVGYDGDFESAEALRLADSIAVGAGAQLLVQTVELEPASSLGTGRDEATWLADIREHQATAGRALAEAAAATTVARARVGVSLGDPGLELRKFSESVDLMVIGSRRWGTFARVVLGGAGETLASDCGASLIVVPRAGSTSRSP